MNRKQRRANKKMRPGAVSLQDCVDAVHASSVGRLPHGAALVVLAFKGGPEGQIAFGSNATRAAAIAALRFVAERLEAGDAQEGEPTEQKPNN